VKTELAIRKFPDSRISANLSPATIAWYKDRLAFDCTGTKNIPS